MSSAEKFKIVALDADSSLYTQLASVCINLKCKLEIVKDRVSGWNRLFFSQEHADLLIVNPCLFGHPLEFLVEVRAINPWLPIIVYTDKCSHDFAKAACNFRVSGYFEKEKEGFKLAARVSEILTGEERLAEGRACPPFVMFGDRSPQEFHPLTLSCLVELHRNYHSTLSLDRLAKRCDVSKQHLCRIFKKDCGSTIGEYVSRIRLEMAKRLLKNSNYAVSHIQEMIGYKSRTHFFKIFRNETKLSPSEYRKTVLMEKASEEAQ